MYIECICLPEMKKTKEYGIQLVLSAKESDIQYARCGAQDEKSDLQYIRNPVRKCRCRKGCPAGRAPHGSCEHIAVLCYCLVKLQTLGKFDPMRPVLKDYKRGTSLAQNNVCKRDQFSKVKRQKYLEKYVHSKDKCKKSTESNKIYNQDSTGGELHLPMKK